MKIVQVPKKHIAQVYRLALDMIPETDATSFNSPYICDNINDLARASTPVPGGDRAIKAALDIIDHRLGRFFSLKEWLLDHGVQVTQVNDEAGQRALQVHRKQWLKKLIKEFNTPGSYYLRIW